MIIKTNKPVTYAPAGRCSYHEFKSTHPICFTQCTEINGLSCLFQYNYIKQPYQYSLTSCQSVTIFPGVENVDQGQWIPALLEFEYEQLLDSKRELFDHACSCSNDQHKQLRFEGELYLYLIRRLPDRVAQGQGFEPDS